MFYKQELFLNPIVNYHGHSLPPTCATQQLVALQIRWDELSFSCAPLW